MASQHYPNALPKIVEFVALLNRLDNCQIAHCPPESFKKLERFGNIRVLVRFYLFTIIN